MLAPTSSPKLRPRCTRLPSGNTLATAGTDSTTRPSVTLTLAHDNLGTMSVPDRQLEPGRDFKSAPLHKLIRARMLTRELSDSFKEYRYSLGLEVIAKIDESRRGVRFYARLASPPPLAIWTSLFADIVHNYRAELDGFAWELAHPDRGKPPKPTQLYFPIFDAQDKWDKATSTTLSSMPTFVLGRLNQVQPFHVEPVKDGIGLLLHALDNEDKHRAAMSINLKAMDKTSWNYSVRYDRKDRGQDDPQPIRWIGPEVDGEKFEKAAFFILGLMDQQVSTSFEIVSTGTLRLGYSRSRWTSPFLAFDRGRRIWASRAAAADACPSIRCTALAFAPVLTSKLVVHGFGVDLEAVDLHDGVVHLEAAACEVDAFRAQAGCLAPAKPEVGEHAHQESIAVRLAAGFVECGGWRAGSARQGR